MVKRFDPSYYIITVVAVLLYIPFLGQVHLFDWDEINFAECAREMIRSHDFLQVQINFLPFWEKPPLFIWMQVFSMKIFGVNEFAARFPNAVVGIITLNVLYSIGKKEFTERFAWWWVWCYAGSILPQFYFKSGIIDPSFNLFIFLSIYYNFKLEQNKLINRPAWKLATFTALFLGLAVLTKGPVAIIIFSLCWIFTRITRQGRKNIFNPELVWIAILTVFISVSWFLLIWLKDGSEQIQLFIQYQWRLLTTGDSGHGQPFWYHWVILLFGCFPASVLLFMRKKDHGGELEAQRELKNYMWVLFFVVLILFSLVKTKIVHYSSLCYFPLTFIAARTLYHMALEWRGKKLMSTICIVIGLLISFALILIPFLGTHKHLIFDYVKDSFGKSALDRNVNWEWYTYLPGIIFSSSLILTFLFIKRIQNRFITLFASSVVVVQLAQIIIVPRIELYTQGAAINFYESLKDKNVLVDAYGFKSYAHLFYSDKTKDQARLPLDSLLYGKITVPAYIVNRVDVKYDITQYKEVKEIGRKNGFIFYRRMPK